MLAELMRRNTALLIWDESTKQEYIQVLKTHEYNTISNVRYDFNIHLSQTHELKDLASFWINAVDTLDANHEN